MGSQTRFPVPAGLLALFLGSLVAGCSGGSGGGGEAGPPNAAPTAAFTAAPLSGPAPLVVDFDASASRDTDGAIAKYAWNFADGSSGAGVSARHTFTAGGMYVVQLTVTDNRGTASAATRSILSISRVAAAGYTAVAIPSLGGWYIEPRAINNAGQVVGFSYFDSTERAHAFLYQNGTTRDLGTLGGNESYARDINDSGDVVGISETSGDSSRAFLYRGGVMRDLGTLGGSSSEANAINAAGVVVGAADDQTQEVRGFVYDGTQMKSVGHLGGDYCRAESIDGQGRIAGESRTAGNEIHAFVYRSGVMSDIGTLGGGEAWVAASNDLGDVVGLSHTASGTVTGFLYRGGAMRELVPSYTEALDVNNGGVVVGVAQVCSCGRSGAFVWDEVNGLQDLNNFINPSLGWTLQVAQGINDRGQIVGHGSTSSGAHVAVLLTPVAGP